jgi:metallo-beta-lactamase family protein
MTITFHGAARCVTGSKHIIHLKQGKNILLDCGLFQGMGKDTLVLNSEWGFDPEMVDYVIISHAHVDHTGLLPKLVKDGYSGKIYCTQATFDLMKIMLPDSAHIQEADVRYANKEKSRKGHELVAPLYTAEDAAAVFPLVEIVAYNVPLRIDDDIELLYTDCGHIIGSAAVNLTLKEDGKQVRLTFSGDVGRYNDMLLHSPADFPQADYIIMESTYGNRLHDLMVTATEKLFKHIVHTCLEKKGKLIMPTFSVGRTQEILYMLNQLEMEHRLPPLDYFVDSPLSVSATGIVSRHTECFNEQIKEVMSKDKNTFSFKGLKMIVKVEESMALNDRKTPCVIISASGMAEAGRVKHHIMHAVEDATNTILLTGYCEPRSLGGRLKNHNGYVNIYGRRFDVNAEIASMQSLSAHGDYEDLCRWLSCQDASKVKRLFLVHGEYDTQFSFRERLERKGFTDIEIPDLHQELELFL